MSVGESVHHVLFTSEPTARPSPVVTLDTMDSSRDAEHVGSPREVWLGLENSLSLSYSLYLTLSISRSLSLCISLSISLSYLSLFLSLSLSLIYL